MKRLFALLLLMLSLGMQPTWAADDPTYTYIQFSGNGRTVLLDTDGALSVVNATDNAPVGDGYQWTLETAPSTTTAEVVLKSKAGHYVVYNTTDKSFTTTTDATAATAFTQSTNTYYSATAGSTRYDLSISNLTGKNALAVKNGALTLAVTNSRYSTVRLATTVSGPSVNPMVSTTGDEHWYYMELLLNGSECIKDAAKSGDKLIKTATPSIKYLNAYMWSIVEANDQGDVYFKSKAGNYIAQLDGTYQYVTSDESERNSSGRYKLCDVADNANYAGTFVIYNQDKSRYVYPYGSGSPDIGIGSSFQPGERMRFIETDTRLLTTPHVIQFTAQGAQALYDSNADNNVTVKTPTDDDNADGYTWQFEAIAGQTDAYALKSNLGHYLKYADNAFSTTSNADEAVALFPLGNDYDPYHTRISLTLADDASKAIGYKDNALYLSDAAASLYTVTRMVESTAQVVGTALPHLSTLNDTYYYKLQFKANHAGDNRLTLTTNGYGTPVVNTEARPANINQNWILKAATNPKAKEGDFYLLNQLGEYLCFDGSKFVIRPQYDENSTTVYRFMQDDTQPDYWMIDMPLSSATNHTIGLRDTDVYTLKECGVVSAYNYLSFKPSVYVSEYNYLEFTGNGRTALFEKDGALTAVSTTEAQPTGDGYQWMSEPAEQNNVIVGMVIKSKAGHYVKYDATTKTFSSVANKAEASIFVRSENTYYTASAGASRYNYTLYGNTDTYNTLGVKNGQLQLVRANSRYAVVRRTTSLRGALLCPMVSTDDKQYYYHIDLRTNGDELLHDAADGNVLQKTTETILPLKELRWSIYEANDLGDVYFKSFKGHYIYCDGTDQRVTADESVRNAKGRYRLCDIADNADPLCDGHWMIHNYNSDKRMAAYGPNENKVGISGYYDPKNRVRFTELASSDTTYRYLLFPAMGMKPLVMEYNDEGQVQLHAHTINSQNDQPDLYQWRIDGLHIGNKAGYFIAYNDKDNTFGVTTNKDEAYPFEFSLNTYENNDLVRDNLLSTDEQQALSIDEDGNLRWGQPNTRYSVAHFRSFPLAPKLPVSSADGVRYQLYYLQTQGGSHYNYTLDADNAHLSLQPAATDDLRQLWVFVSDGQGIGDCYLQSAYNRTFLKYDATATAGQQFAATTNKAEATHVRLVESNTQPNYWQLQLVGADDDSNVITHNYTTSGGTTTGAFALTTPNNGNNFVNFIAADITPEFYDEEGGAYRNLLLKELDTPLQLVAQEDGTVTAEATTSTNTNHNSWKGIGTSQDFVLRNANGKYLTTDSEGTVTLTDDETEATHFFLWLNHPTTDGYLTWMFGQLPDDGQVPSVPNLCLGYDETANCAKLLPFSTYLTDKKHTLCFTFSAPTSPALTTDGLTGKNFYYFAHFDKLGNYYMSDGDGTSVDAIVEGKRSVNDQMWAFVGQSKEDFVVMSKDKYYLYFNPTKLNFDVTHDLAQAAHFSATYRADVDRYTFTLVGGAGTDGYVGWLLVKSGNTPNLTLDTEAHMTGNAANRYYLRFEEIDQPEDYSDYEIRPKRSWFVKLAREAQTAPMTGFIQRDEEGWTVNPYTHRLMQKTSTYTITHYLKCQSTHDLYVPTCMIGSAATRSRAYQRWYNYKTDEAVSDSVLYLDINSSRKYRNGLVVGDRLNFNGGYGGFVDHYVIFQMPENVPDDWEYILGADLTTYTDFVDYFGDNGNPLYTGEVTNDIVVPTDQDLIEPTVTGRNVFIIRNARAIANQLLNYREGSEHWLEEKTIAFPRKKVTLNISTVNLNMQKADYWFYNAATAAEDNLQNAVSYGGKIDIEIDDPLRTGITSAGFQANGLSSASERAIGFNYPGDTNGLGMGEAKAEQCVLKVYGHASDGTRYQIAKFTLKFEDDFEPILYTEVIGKKADGTFKSDRSPEALQAMAGNPVATITFDPDQYDTFITPPVGTNTSFSDNGAGEAANRTYDRCYRYPLNYDNSSYCFAPMSTISDQCTWGNYTISKKFDSATAPDHVTPRGIFYPIKKFYQDFYGAEQYDASKAAFLYIDASDLPGQVASIDFSGQACTGSRLYVSAWMSSPDRDKESPANVVFRVEGITNNGKVDTLYSYCPGPILGQARDASGKTWNPGADNNKIGLWQQVFFSFINKSATPYAQYRLTINNACTNTRGGDILIDDIEVFALKPSVQLERTTPVCDQQITLAKMTADFDVILQQLGLTENEDLTEGNPNMWYCLVDKDIYDQELVRNAIDPSDYIPSTTDVWRAFTAGLVGDPNLTTGPERAFRHIEFTTHYDDDALLPPFDYAKALRGTDAQRFKEQSGAGERRFIISDHLKGANLQPKHDYYILFKPRFSSDPITINNAVDAFELGTDCSIMATFRTESAITVVNDADDDSAIDNEVQTCAGKSVALSVKQNGTDDDGSQPNRMTQYDWWRDYVGGAFTQIYVNTANSTWRFIDLDEDPVSTEITLREALMTFRHFYPTATTPAGAQPQSDGVFTLTQPIIDVLLQLTQNTTDGVAPLLLLNNTCNVFLPLATPQGQIEYVTVIPIDHTNDDGSVQYCYDPEMISILVSGQAPQLFDGLNGATDTYPDHLTNVPIRTSLAAVSEVTEQSANTAPDNVLRLPLRSMVTITNGALGMQHITPADGDLGDVYITATNDPAMTVYNTFAGKVEGFRTVGQVKVLDALTASPAEAHADIYFLNDFRPREGYTYTLRIDFRERFAEGDATVSIACDGTLLFDLIIVPQYEVWTGAAGNTDWTNDANWARADRTELLRDAADGADYVTNATNGTAQGFAPMLHTNVIVTPQTAGPLLYATDYNSAEGDSFVHFIDHEGDQRTATPDIEYHLLAQKQATAGFNLCSRYTTYQADGLVMQTGGELLHPERLTYTNAWMEYALTPGRWYTLGSPLQHTYAGDWYAPTDNAQQLTPYFEDVTFNTTDYNRFAPAVYQRSWDKANSLLYYLAPYSADAPQQAAVQNKDVYQAIAWSKAFNDVQTPYGVGGFSVKVNAKGATDAYTQSLFRLPKEDTAFSYYTTAQATDGKTYTIDRTKSHRLIADQLNDAGAVITQTLTNKNTANAYFLVSNPFTCGLDMNQFFSTNATVLDGAKYWLLTADGQLGVMQNADDKQWTTVNDATATTAQGILAPGQGFFVKAAQPTGSLSLRFTADMMTSAKAVGSTLRAPARRQPLAGSLRTLRIRAARGGLQSEAIVVKDTEANNDFASSEDLEALVDNALTDVPTVYTLAGTQASTINRRCTMFRVPLGILSNSDAPTRLTFTGLNGFNETLSLLDEQTGLVTPLTLSTGAKADSVTVEVSGNAVGRYYILSSAEPTPDDLASLTRPLIQVDGQRLAITASPAHPLTHIEVVDAAGRILYQMKPFTASLRLKLPQGIYVVEARTDEGKTVSKVTLR